MPCTSAAALAELGDVGPQLGLTRVMTMTESPQGSPTSFSEKNLLARSSASRLDCRQALCQYPLPLMTELHATLHVRFGQLRKLLQAHLHAGLQGDAAGQRQ